MIKVEFVPYTYAYALLHSMQCLLLVISHYNLCRQTTKMTLSHFRFWQFLMVCLYIYLHIMYHCFCCCCNILLNVVSFYANLYCTNIMHYVKIILMCVSPSNYQWKFETFLNFASYKVLISYSVYFTTTVVKFSF